MTERCVVFDCSGDKLVAILHEPDADARGTGVLFIVGGPQYRVGSHRQFVLIARDFCAAGYPVLRFDYRGMGDSDGAQRSFEAVQDDIANAVTAFFAARPGIANVVVFGLCDAASAAMMYCVAGERRLSGMILANPWVRTEVGEAKAYVQHYYGQRLLQCAFWAKVLAGQFDVRESIGGLMAAVKRAFAGPSVAATAATPHFTERMLTGLSGFGGRVLLLMSGRDLTAREFDSLARASRDWSHRLAQPRFRRLDLADADHTFSSAAALEAASRAAIAWLNETPQHLSDKDPIWLQNAG